MHMKNCEEGYDMDPMFSDVKKKVGPHLQTSTHPPTFVGLTEARRTDYWGPIRSYSLYEKKINNSMTDFIEPRNQGQLYHAMLYFAAQTPHAFTNVYVYCVSVSVISNWSAVTMWVRHALYQRYPVLIIVRDEVSAAAMCSSSSELEGCIESSNRLTTNQ